MEASLFGAGLRVGGAAGGESVWALETASGFEVRGGQGAGVGSERVGGSADAGGESV